MPVIGHACVGAAAAIWTYGPFGPRSHERIPLDLWMLLLVGLAYVPDITSQLLWFAGPATARAIGHSIPLALTAAGIGAALPPGRSVTRVRMFAIVLGSILLHDLMDLFQSSDRMPFWPMSTWSPAGGWTIIPTSLAGETLVFAPVAAVAFAGRWWTGRRSRTARPWTRRRVIALGAVGVIVATAALTHRVRDLREADLRQAARLNAKGDYRAALALCDRAEAWPSPAKAGRVDYLRAEAWMGLGDAGRAEKHYLASHRADPTYFWTVADLAVLYASGEGSPESRRASAQPWIQLMREEFASEPALPQILARVERKLAAPAPSAPGRP